MTDEELPWEPVPGCWSVRRRASGPEPRATVLVGAGEWGLDAAFPSAPWPPPFTTVAWRLGHLSSMLALRADHTTGSRSLRREDYAYRGDVPGAVAGLDAGASAWREALLQADDAALDEVGHSQYPYGSDREERFVDIV